VNHRREPGHEQVTLGRSCGQHAHLVRAEPPVGQRPPGGLGRQFLVEHHGHAVVIDGVVPRLDPVGRERPAEQLDGARRVRCEPGGELVVVDWLAGQEGAGAGDVGLVHEPHSATGRRRTHGLRYSAECADGLEYRYSGGWGLRKRACARTPGWTAGDRGHCLVGDRTAYLHLDAPARTNRGDVSRPAARASRARDPPRPRDARPDVGRLSGLTVPTWPGTRAAYQPPPTLARQNPEHLRQSCHWPQSRPRLSMGASAQAA
jgi:hypothetical protein